MAADTTAPAVLPVRRVRFEYPPDADPCWAPHLPEFAYAANAISLGMPYAEPLFIRAVRSTYDDLPDDLRARTETYVKQEVGHHTQHKRWNDVVNARYPATVRLQRWMAASTHRIDGRSRRFRVAYAAAGETISYGVARWTEKHLARLMDRADPVVATLYLWHLAEEIEHKSATYEVFEQTDGSKLEYSWALTVAFTQICLFTIIGTLMQMWKDRRIFNPVSWVRALWLAASLAFALVPVMVTSALPGHHPRQFSDPVWLPTWLKGYDDATGTMPIYRSEATTPSAA
jgi:predicted metal-dependent hydrolase